MVSLRDRVDILIRIAFGLAIAIGCYFIIAPFLTAITISAIVTVVSWPLFKRFKNSMGERATPAALLMVILLTVLIIIPITFLSAAIAQQLPVAIAAASDYIRTISAPLWLKDIPMVGPWLYNQVAIVFEPKAMAELIKKLIDPVSRELVSIALQLGNGLVQLTLVAFIAFFFYRDGDSLAERVNELLEKVSGSLSQELSLILVNTTRSVVYGIVGTSAAQSLMACIGFVIVDAPGTLLLTVAVFIFSVVPIGPPIVWGPVAIWLWMQGDIGMAIFLVVWGSTVVALVDNLLKPLLIARGTPLPISLVFLGVFGGVIAFGFLGLILGPVLLAVGVALVITWLSQKGRKQIAKQVSTITFPPLKEAEDAMHSAPAVAQQSGPKASMQSTAPRRNHPRNIPSGKKK